MSDIMVNYKGIGERIAKRRREMKLTQDALTDIAEMSINQLSNIENGHSLPKIETIIKLSHALKTTPDYFLLGETRETENQLLTAITHRVALCTEKQQRLVIDFIDLLIKENY